MKRLTRHFFTQPTLKVSKDLLGKYIVRKIAGKTLAGKIVETEAYIGPEDRASHAYGGKITPRNKAEWMIGGHIYIYLVYGMYWQLNISTGLEGSPECVLIRAVEPCTNNLQLTTNYLRQRKGKNSKSRQLLVVSGLSAMLHIANGPGKLCRWLKLDKSFYGEDVTKSKRILFTEGEKIKKSQIASGPRINIDYAGPTWSKKPWRFWIKENKFVSK